MGSYNNDNTASDALMPPGFFAGTQGLFGSLGGGAQQSQAGGGGGLPMGLFSMMGDNTHGKSNDFNPFDIPDVNPFIMAAMDKDMRDHGGEQIKLQD